MKQSFLYCFVCILLLSCNNQQTPETKVDNITKKNSLPYPFTAKYSLNWQPGDEKNAVIVLNCLKKYVDGDIKGCTDYFADTAEFIADRFHYKGSRDSLRNIIGAMRNASVKVSKEFDTWLTTYYPDKDETWVTLWYTEKMTDHTGKMDSVYYTDDVLMKNGKIVQYDEKAAAVSSAGEITASLKFCREPDLTYFIQVNLMFNYFIA